MTIRQNNRHLSNLYLFLQIFTNLKKFLVLAQVDLLTMKLLKYFEKIFVLTAYKKYYCNQSDSYNLKSSLTFLQTKC